MQSLQAAVAGCELGNDNGLLAGVVNDPQDRFFAVPRQDARRVDVVASLRKQTGLGLLARIPMLTLVYFFVLGGSGRDRS